jgi:hypothetical protein
VPEFLDKTLRVSSGSTPLTIVGAGEEAGCSTRLILWRWRGNVGGWFGSYRNKFKDAGVLFQTAGGTSREGTPP